MKSIWFHVSTPSVFTSTHTWFRTHLLSRACSGFSTLMDCMLDTHFTQNSCYMHCTMICKHAQNHPKVDCTKHPILDDLETFTFIQNWIIQNIQFRKMYNHPKVDYTKLLPLDDLQACSESSKSGLYKTSKFEWLRNMFAFIQNWIIPNIQIWMISSTFQLYVGNNRHHDLTHLHLSHTLSVQNPHASVEPNYFAQRRLRCNQKYSNGFKGLIGNSINWISILNITYLTNNVWACQYSFCSSSMLSKWQIGLLWGCQKENEWYLTMSQGN